MDSGRVGTTTARVSLLMTSLLLPNAVLPDISLVVVSHDAACAARSALVSDLRGSLEHCFVSS